MKRLGVLLLVLVLGGCGLPLKGHGEVGLVWDTGKIGFYSKAHEESNAGVSMAELDIADLADFIIEMKKLQAEVEAENDDG